MTDGMTLEDITELINIAIATARIRTLKTPTKSLRPFMHMIMCGSVGSIKSTILKEVCQALGTQWETNLSSATLLGSVDKSTGITNPPAVWEARNSVLAIDELNLNPHSYDRVHFNTFLSILENPQYSKKVGYRINDFEEKDKDLYFVARQGRIQVKSRFVFLGNTMTTMLMVS